jgi:hypothetical protein
MIDLHNHTTWSDGAFSPQAIIQAGVDAGLAHVGICDHYATRKLPPDATVRREQIADYAAAVREAAAAYADRIQVWVGLEIDSAPSRTDLGTLGLHGGRADALDGLDYVLFEYVGQQELDGLPLAPLVALRPRIGVPVGLAHSFLAGTFDGRRPPDELAQTLARAELFVELCPTERNAVLTLSDLLGMPRIRGEEKERRQALWDQPALWERGFLPAYRYPSPYNEALWPALVSAGVRLSIGSDTHTDLADVGAVDDAWAFVQEVGATCFPPLGRSGSSATP